MYHICQEEDSIGVILVAESVLLGERVFVLDLVIILLLQIKIFVSPLAHLDQLTVYALFFHINRDIHIAIWFH